MHTEIESAPYCNIGLLVRRIWILYITGMMVGLCRIWIRTSFNRKLSWEEAMIVVAIIFWTGNVTLSALVVRKGTNQLTSEEGAKLSPLQLFDRTVGSKMMIANWFSYTTFLWASKTCLLLLYTRLMQGVKQRRYIKVAAWTLGVTYLSSILSLFLVCRPFYKNWQVAPYPGCELFPPLSS